MNKILILPSLFFVLACESPISTTTTSVKEKQKSSIHCSEKGCEGSYIGSEFVEGEDVAHQFSNKMSEKVGNQLKRLYSNGAYSKVDFGRISMSTKGIGTGEVVYELSIPFMRVKEKCDAFTSFDHVGGWNHTPALLERKNQLKKVVLKGDELVISSLKTTPEGLQEYWIQWRNKDVQSDCGINGIK